MKLFVVLAVAALSSAAKLDKTYLPPSHSPTSGGSGNFLQTPFGADQGQSNGFAGNGNAYAQNGNGFGQNGNGFSQNGNGFVQNGNDYAQNGNGFTQNGNDYAQNGNGFAQNGDGFAQNGGAFSNGNFENQPERPQAAFERNAAILRQDNQNDGETYSYAYETENGIYAEENGVATNGVEAQGGYSYTGDDGQVYSVRYTADQNGFVPQGDHLPTPPPVPEEILKALEQNARDEAAGIYDDGTYNEGKYSNGEEQYNNNANFGNNYSQNEYEGGDDSVVTTNALLRNSGSNSFNNQGSFRNGNQAGFNGQNGNQRGFETGATSQAYLPPFSGQRTSSNGNGNHGSYNHGNGNQGGFNGGNGNQRGFDNGATSQAYLPPSAGQRASSNQGSENFNHGSFNGANAKQRGFNGGNANQGAFDNGASSQGVNKAYLPPFAGQRTSNGAAFGSRTRQPSFNARSGYRY